MITWQCLSFSQLTTQQLYDLLKLRVNVFVVEQNCPYSELDGKDKNIQDVGTPDTEEIDYSIVKEAISNKHRYGEILKPYKNGFLIVSDDVAKDNKYFDIKFKFTIFDTSKE